MKTQTSAAPLRAEKPVVRKPASALQRAADSSGASQSLLALQLMADASVPVQRMEEDELQGKFIQRMEEDELQMKPIQRIEDEDPLQGKLVQRAEAQAPKANNTGLPDNLKSGIENLSGMSMDHVRVHRNSDKPATVQAHAYAQGSQIHLGPGQEKHLPHEAWHVVQQAQGRVKPTMQLKGVAVNDDAGLEHEADVMGAKALQMKPTAVMTSHHEARSTSGKVAQRIKTRAESVAGDLLHSKYDTLFSSFDASYTTTYTANRNRMYHNQLKEMTKAVNAKRNFSFAQLSTDTLSKRSDLTDLAGDSAEHMYIHVGDTIHRADRTDEKLPHPTLAGGDPDVTCAGTLIVTEYDYDADRGNTPYLVTVTKDSGHFRPGAIPDSTIDAVKDIVGNARQGDTYVNVKKSNR